MNARCAMVRAPAIGGGPLLQEIPAGGIAGST